MAVALYRRYRPDTFDDLVGQDHVTDLLRNALKTGRSSHAYLFSGPRGCGKTTSARILARCMNCEQGPTDTPCGVCESCVDLAAGGPGSLDVIEIDAASHNGVDDARELRERASFAPARDRYKIFILDEAHMVTTQGFNALLKIVEEPPEHVKFIFATTEPEKVIGTIRSRTHHYPFRLVSSQVLSPFLAEVCEEEGVRVAPGVLDLVIRAGGGSVRDSLSVLDQLIAGAGEDGIDHGQAVALLGYTDSAMLEEMVDALGQMRGFDAFRIVESATSAGVDALQFTKDLLQMLRDLLICGLIPGQAAEVLPHVPVDQLQRMLVQAETWGTRRLSRSADQLEEALRTMSGTASPKLQLELLLGRLLTDAEPAQQPPAVQRPAAAPSAPVEKAETKPEKPQPRRTAPPPAERAPESVPADNLAQRWEQVQAAVDRHSRVSGVVAKGTRPVGIVSGVLQIHPEQSVRGRLGAGSAAHQHITAAVAEVFGSPLKVEVVDGSAPATPPPAAASPPAKPVVPAPPEPEPVEPQPVEPEPPEPEPVESWDDDISSEDETVESPSNRGLPALLEVLGGTVIEEEGT